MRAEAFGEDAREHADRLLAVGPGYIIMRYRAHGGRGYAVHKDAVRFECFAELAGRHACFADIEDDDVGLHLARVQAHSGKPGQLGRQIPRIGVIFGEALRHLFQRDETGCRQHAGLPHAAAQALTIQTPARDRIGFANHHRSGGSAESF